MADLQFDHRLRPPAQLECTCCWQGEASIQHLRLVLASPGGQQTLSLFLPARGPVTRTLSLTGFSPGRYQLVLQAEGADAPLRTLYTAPLILPESAAAPQLRWRCQPWRGWFRTTLVSTVPLAHDQVTLFGSFLPSALAAGIPLHLLTRFPVTPFSLSVPEGVSIQTE